MFPFRKQAQVGDVGLEIVLTVKKNGSALDISQAVTKRMLFRGPDGRNFEINAAFKNTGTDGKLTYSTASSDFHIGGDWEVQAKLSWTGVTAITLYTYPCIFRVRDNANRIG